MSNHPLIRAVRSQDIQRLEKLLGADESPHAKIETKYYPLHTAAQVNAVKEIGLLHKNGANANEEDHFGQTPMHVAASQGAVLALKKLVLLGGNSRRTDRNGNTPLHLATSLTSGRVQHTLIEDLIAAGADVNACNNDGVTPLHLAAQSGSIEAMKLLLENKADPCILTKNRCSIMDFARTHNKKDLQNLLKIRGFRANSKSNL